MLWYWKLLGSTDVVLERMLRSIDVVVELKIVEKGQVVVLGCCCVGSSNGVLLLSCCWSSYGVLMLLCREFISLCCCVRCRPMKMKASPFKSSSSSHFSKREQQQQQPVDTIYQNGSYLGKYILSSCFTHGSSPRRFSIMCS